MAKINFTRLFNDKNVYYAQGDDGKVWTFTDEGEAWNVRNDLSLPDYARSVDPQRWTAAGLPLDVDSSIVDDDDAPADAPAPADDAPVEARNFDSANAPPANAPPGPAADADLVGTAETADAPALPRVSGYRRAGDGTVPFVVLPCSLVVPLFRIRKVGGGVAVKYVREDESATETPLNVEGMDDETETVVKRTTRVIEGVKEFRAANAARQNARNAILKCCADTVIGRLCAKEREPELRAMIDVAREKIRAMNAGMILHRITDGVVVASIETDAAVAAATVRDSLKDAMDGLKDAFAKGDAETMRAIVAGLKGFDALVNDEAAMKVSEAIDEARRIARVLTREVEKKGRALEAVQQELSTEAIDATRFMLIAQEGAVDDSPVEDMPVTDARSLDARSLDAPMADESGVDEGASVDEGGAESVPDDEAQSGEAEAVAAQGSDESDEGAVA